MTIEAKVIAHSAHPRCRDLITIQARYPRFIHPELMAHRAFSRNASSSRAVPIQRMIQDVWDDLAMPEEWGRNQAGMQAGAEIDFPDDAKDTWLMAAKDAVYHARRLADLGLHKQVVNRILEPFSHISVVITATDWNWFFHLRCHPDADPTMRALAIAMRDAIDGSSPTFVDVGQWHTPYGGTIRQSVARCARVSYLNHDGTQPDAEKDDILAEKLLSSGHYSPFEHQATPTPNRDYYNLRGWMSQRAEMEYI
jgi:thymidylate synthase ThyX